MGYYSEIIHNMRMFHYRFLRISIGIELGKMSCAISQPNLLGSHGLRYGIWHGKDLQLMFLFCKDT